MTGIARRNAFDAAVSAKDLRETDYPPAWAADPVPDRRAGENRAPNRLGLVQLFKDEGRVQSLGGMLRQGVFVRPDSVEYQGGRAAILLGDEEDAGKRRFMNFSIFERASLLCTTLESP